MIDFAFVNDLLEVTTLSKPGALLQSEELESSRQLLNMEVARVSKQLGHKAGVDEQFVEAWQNALSEMIYLPSQKRYGRIASATNSDKVESLQVNNDILV